MVITAPTPRVCKYSACKVPLESSKDTRIVVELFNGAASVVKKPDGGSSAEVVYLYDNAVIGGCCGPVGPGMPGMPGMPGPPCPVYPHPCPWLN